VGAVGGEVNKSDFPYVLGGQRRKKRMTLPDERAARPGARLVPSSCEREGSPGVEKETVVNDS